MSLIQEELELRLKLRDLEHQDNHRKTLIRLCLARAASLKKLRPGHLDSPKPTTTSQPASDQVTALQEKVHDYELRNSVLKLQLSTKEQAHDAKVDELKSVIDRLQSQLDKYTQSPLLAGRPNLAPGRPASLGGEFSTLRLVSTGRAGSGSFLLPSAPSLFGGSPFSDRTGLQSGKGNSFSGIGLSSAASQASLKLSHVKKEAPVFSNPSSSELTPSRKRAEVPQGSPLVKVPAEAAGEHTQTTVELSGLEDFHSANNTFAEPKRKRERIRLFSTEATKLLVELQDKGLDVEDVNSLNYYADDNFKDDKTVPTGPLEAAVAAEPAPKKRHVFKI